MSDTTQIILAIIGTGVALFGFLWRLDARMGAMEHRLNSRIDSLRQEMRTDIAALNSRIDALRQEMRTDIAALHARIDNLYQALFNRKDPAA